jgi:mono/diheme cytochrome c family protein
MYKKIISGLILTGIMLAGCNTDTTSSSQTETGTASTTTVSTPDPVRGASLFATNCAACHGQEGMGSNQGPPLINPIYKPSHHDNFAFYRAVIGGSRQHHWQFGDMPPVPGVSMKDTADIIAYVRQQQRLAGIE